MTSARANQTTGLTNGGATNWAPEVEFSPFNAPSSNDVPVLLLNQPIDWAERQSLVLQLLSSVMMQLSIVMGAINRHIQRILSIKVSSFYEGGFKTLFLKWVLNETRKTSFIYELCTE